MKDNGTFNVCYGPIGPKGKSAKVFKPSKSPKAKCKKRKLKLSKGALALAKRYEEIWHEEFYKLARWEQTVIIEEPIGRHASVLAKTVAQLAELEEK